MGSQRSPESKCKNQMMSWLNEYYYKGPIPETRRHSQSFLQFRSGNWWICECAESSSLSVQLYTTWNWSNTETFHKDCLNPPSRVMHYKFAEVLGFSASGVAPSGQTRLIWSQLFYTCAHMHVCHFFCQIRLPGSRHAECNTSLLSHKSQRNWQRALNRICCVRMKMWGSNCSIYRLSASIISGQLLLQTLPSICLIPKLFKGSAIQILTVFRHVSSAAIYSVGILLYPFSIFKLSCDVRSNFTQFLYSGCIWLLNS